MYARRVRVLLTSQQLAGVRRHAALHGITASDVLREGLDQLLASPTAVNGRST